MNEAPQAPRKLFREPGETGSIKCLACGAPIALHSFGALQRVVCSHCGSSLAPDDSGALALLEAVARAHQPSVLPLHARGTLDGIQWEIIGICWRRVVVDGVAYPWQEFLLFNPYHGFRWLIFNKTDGHWSFGKNLDGAPQSLRRQHLAVRFAGKTYRHFQGGTAAVTYVEGEFTWEVRVGDEARADDFVAPPYGLSVEQSSGNDGTEFNFTEQRHLDRREVWKAFDCPGKPPREHGVGMLRPNTWRRQAGSMWLSCFLLFAAWWGVRGYVDSSGPPASTVFERQAASFDEPFTEEIEIGNDDRNVAVDFRFSATPLDNSWAYAEVLLVHMTTEEAIGVELEVGYYFGRSGGESWTEGSRAITKTLGAVPSGRYLLQVTPQRDTAGLSPTAAANIRSPTGFSLRIEQDVPLTRYDVLALLIIFLFPLFGLIMGFIIEKNRWSNSDYAS